MTPSFHLLFLVPTLTSHLVLYTQWQWLCGQVMPSYMGMHTYMYTWYVYARARCYCLLKCLAYSPEIWLKVLHAICMYMYIIHVPLVYHTSPSCLCQDTQRYSLAWRWHFWTNVLSGLLAYSSQWCSFSFFFFRKWADLLMLWKTSVSPKRTLLRYTTTRRSLSVRYVVIKGGGGGLRYLIWWKPLSLLRTSEMRTCPSLIRTLPLI